MKNNWPGPGGEGVCMHDHIDSIGVPVRKLGSNGEMSGWGQASVGMRAGRQWLAVTQEFQQISSKFLPNPWSGPVIAFRPYRNMVTRTAWSQAISDSSWNREGCAGREAGNLHCCVGALPQGHEEGTGTSMQCLLAPPSHLPKYTQAPFSSKSCFCLFFK